MRVLIKNILLLCIVFFPSVIIAQSTKIKGRVIDLGTKEPIAFANIFFIGSTVGTTTDMNGVYYIETRENVADTLVFSMMGYEDYVVKYKVASFNEINVELRELPYSLGEIVVKPDNRYLNSILLRIKANKKNNNPNEKDRYSCDLYTKMELDVSNIESYLNIKKIKKNFGFVKNYMDTSVILGKAFLPVMISESKSKSYFRKEPFLRKEVIMASRISGVDNNEALSQFTGNMHANVNLYDNYIDILGVKLASPLCEHGNLYYNYFLIDSLDINGRKTYKIRFHPKTQAVPVFDGEINIDSTTMGLKSAHIKMYKDVNVNWVRNIFIDSEYDYLEKDASWFMKLDKLSVDFAPTMNDSSKVVSFMAHRTIIYSNPNFTDSIPDNIHGKRNSLILSENVINNNKEFWQKERPISLSVKEQGIYNMVDSIRRVPFFRDVTSIVRTILTGYINTNYFEYGPIYKLFSFNNLEGLRFQAGGRTTKEFSTKVRLNAYLAYGTKDRQFKGGASVELPLGKYLTRKFTFSYKKDVQQLGASKYAFSESNIFSSLFSKGNTHRLCDVEQACILYEHELVDGINMSIETENLNIRPTKYVPMFRPDSTAIKNVSSASIHLGGRISWQETVTRGYFAKAYVQTNYPVLFFDITYSPFKSGSYYQFLRFDGRVRYKLHIPPIGVSTFNLQFGKVFGKVPYPFLKLHEGNGSYFYVPMAFACMKYYEFAADTWVELFYEHNFKGFFLGKIPLLKKLKCREAVSFRAAYGTLSKKNNGTVSKDKPNPTNVIMLFPYGMSSLSTPYFEVGVGITNIFNLLRVDAFWRLNHKQPLPGVKKTNFAINVGIDFQF